MPKSHKHNHRRRTGESTQHRNKHLEVGEAEASVVASQPVDSEPELPSIQIEKFYNRLEAHIRLMGKKERGL